MLRPNNNQLYSYYLLLLIPTEYLQIPVNTTYNKIQMRPFQTEFGKNHIQSYTSFLSKKYPTLYFHSFKACKVQN